MFRKKSSLLILFFLVDMSHGIEDHHHHQRHHHHLERYVRQVSFTRKNTTAWPVKRSVDIEGDIYLGGLHMIHEREDSITCGPIMPQGGVQAMEIMLFTVDYINNVMSKNGQWIQGVKLGAHVLDDCDKDTYGLETSRGLY